MSVRESEMIRDSLDEVKNNGTVATKAGYINCEASFQEMLKLSNSCKGVGEDWRTATENKSGKPSRKKSPARGAKR